MGWGSLHLCPPIPRRQSPLPVKDVADVGAGAEGEEQCPGLQGGTEQAVQARGSHRSCGAANAASPAENTFQAGEARDQVLGAQGGRTVAQGRAGA